MISTKMKLAVLAGATLALGAVATSAGAVDCAKWADHKPGYCGVTSAETQCNSSANQVPGKCAIPVGSFYVNSNKELIDNRSQSLLAAAGTFDLRDANGAALALVASGGGNLVASGAGNLVASGAGNLVGGRSIMATGGKKVFVLQR